MIPKLTTQEARQLIEELKRTVEKVLEMPHSKGGISFDVTAIKDSIEFVITIDRKGISGDKCSYQGRIKSNNLILLRLDVNPTGIHYNPDGSKIIGTHVHIYNELDDMKRAFPFDIKKKSLYDLCFTFFQEFHIIEVPRISEQQCM